MAVTKTLAYYDTAKITAVKSFMAQAPAVLAVILRRRVGAGSKPRPEPDVIKLFLS